MNEIEKKEIKRNQGSVPTINSRLNRASNMSSVAKDLQGHCERAQLPKISFHNEDPERTKGRRPRRQLQQRQGRMSVGTAMKQPSE